MAAKSCNWWDRVCRRSNDPLGWRNWAARFRAKHGRRPRVSVADLFGEAVPDDFVDQALAVVALCPDIEFVVLTKRPERMAGYLAKPFEKLRDDINSQAMERGNRVALPSQSAGMVPRSWPLPNLTLGTSAEDQPTFDARVPHLLRCPAARRLVSLEPLLGPVDLTRVSYGAHRFIDCLSGDMLTRPENEDEAPEIYAAAPSSIDGIIVGGESGPRARPFNLDWARSVRDQCKAAGVAFWVKQVGRRPMAHVTGDDGLVWPPGTMLRGNVKCTVDGLAEFVLRDRNGRDIDEFPADLRVREWPA